MFVLNSIYSNWWLGPNRCIAVHILYIKKCEKYHVEEGNLENDRLAHSNNNKANNDIFELIGIEWCDLAKFAIRLAAIDIRVKRCVRFMAHSKLVPRWDIHSVSVCCVCICWKICGWHLRSVCWPENATCKNHIYAHNIYSNACKMIIYSNLIAGNYFITNICLCKWEIRHAHGRLDRY